MQGRTAPAGSWQRHKARPGHQKEPRMKAIQDLIPPASRVLDLGCGSGALLAELTQASADHFGADPEEVLWGEAAWLSDATAKLKDIADQHFRRGEYEA